MLATCLSRRWTIVEYTQDRVCRDVRIEFTVNAFGELCEARGIVHERIPTDTPNMNAYIEALKGILESECYSRHEWISFRDVYEDMAA